MSRLTELKELGARIAAARVEKGLTQNQLGELIGASQSAVCYWESGQRSIPVLILTEVSRALDTSVGYLLGLVSQSGPHADSADRMIHKLRAKLAERDEYIRLMRSELGA